MSRFLGPVVVLGIVGLVVGYFLFGKVAGSYIDIKSLIMPTDSILGQLGNAVRGVEGIRRNILISGGAGAVVGLVVAFVRRS